MVHLVGVDHMVQYDGPVPESIRSEFRSYLVRVCREKDIFLIAEEFSEEALVDVYNARIDTAQEAARSLGIEHRYCDPGGKELSELGIPYFGELLEEAKNKYNAPPSFIMDRELREKVTAYAGERARTYWSIRERYWYDRLIDVLEMNILFICGHEHIERFSSLVLERGHQSTVIDTFWGEKWFTDYRTLGLI